MQYYLLAINVFSDGEMTLLELSHQDGSLRGGLGGGDGGRADDGDSLLGTPIKQAKKKKKKKSKFCVII